MPKNPILDSVQINGVNYDLKDIENRSNTINIDLGGHAEG